MKRNVSPLPKRTQRSAPTHAEKKTSIHASRHRRNRVFETLESRRVLASISGYVYIDTDSDGARDVDEVGVPGALISISGLGTDDTPIQRTTLTLDDGSYRFNDLNAGTYQVTQSQPEAIEESSGATNQLSDLVVAEDDDSTENNFGEASLRTEYFSIGWFFASTSERPAVFREFVAIGEVKAGKPELAASIRAYDPSLIDTTNDAPIAANDAYEVVADNDLNVTTANGVLVNDSDPDGDLLTVTVLQTASNGSLTLESDGAFRYVPNDNFVGTDSFTYSAADIFGDADTATVTITVTAEPNRFTLVENSPNGTSVGVVSAAAVLAEPVSFEFENADADENLKLRPDDHFDGNAAAPVVLIEYLSFQCPACRAVHPVIEDLQEEFEDDLLVVRRHLPLEFNFPNAPAAARAAEAAGRQQAFKEFADLLFDNQDDWNDAANPQTFFDQYAEQLGLNLTQFAADVADPAIAARVQRDADIADDLGATATPTFFLNGEQLSPNPADLNAWEITIDDALDAVDDDFAIDRLTGELFVADSTALDLATNPTFNLVVNATDLEGTTEPINVVVTLVDDEGVAPTAVGDSYDVNEDGVLTIDVAAGVLNNDSDADGDAITAELGTSTNNGSLSLAADGSFVYTPTTNFNGSDSFTYRATDGTLSSEEITVNIAVNAVNDAPNAAADSYATDESVTLNISANLGVLANDSDVDSDSLTASIADLPDNGTVTLESDGSFSYAPDADFIGTDTFTYSVSDGSLSSDATVTITVNASATVNTAPVAVEDAYTTDEGQTLNATLSVLANDSDAENDTLAAVLVTDVANGTLNLASDGSFTYVPDSNFDGTDTFTYAANDGELSSTTTVTITVNATTPINTAPTSVADSYSVDESTTLNVDAATGLLANDTDPENDSLTVTLVDDAANGSLTLNSDGAFVYVPNSGFVGSDTFTYQTSDGELSSSTATVTIVVNNVNNVPVAAADSYTLDTDSVTTLTVDAPGILANDTDDDADVLVAQIVSTTSNGTLNLADNGSFNYTPNAGFVSGTDSFVYIANDGTADSNEVTVTLTVINNPPGIAVDDNYTVNEDESLSVAIENGVLANDDSVDGDSLTAILIEATENGTLNLNADGSFSYVPNQDFFGTDAFTYRVNDGTSDSTFALVTIIVEPINDSPAAVNDDYAVEENETLIIDAVNGLTANDLDLDGDTLTVALVGDPPAGTFSLNDDGSFAFTPEANSSGVVTFTYAASDGVETSSPATVQITITAVNDAPVAEADAYTVDEDHLLVINAAAGLLANDTDIDSETLSVTIRSQPENGSLTSSDDGSFDYFPNFNFNGIDTFTYVASDGDATSIETTVTVAVNPINDRPSANVDSYQVGVDEVLTVDEASGVLANDSDVDGDSITAQIDTNPTSGSVTLNADGSFVYEPNSGFRGTDSFTYLATDGAENSNATTVTLEINTTPTAVDDAYSVDEDHLLVANVSTGVLDNDFDADDDSLSAALIEDVSNGTLNLAADGSFDFLPNFNFAGVDSFTYSVTDGSTTSAAATVTITVNAIQDRPRSEDDSYTVLTNNLLVVNANSGVLSNDSDADGDAITAILETDVTSGELTLNDDGSFDFLPAADFEGSVTFTYVANDDDQDSSPATVTIDVQSNTVLAAINDSYSTTEDVDLSVAAPGVLENDSGNPVSVSRVVDVSNGTLTLATDGSFEYVPNADFNGTDTFTYIASNGTTNSNPATVTIEIQPENDAPVSATEVFTILEDDVLTISAPGILDNDTDADGDPLEAILVADVANGTLDFETDGSLIYTPDANFFGVDSFRYLVTDGQSVSDEVVVSINIEAVNDLTQTINDSYTVGQDGLIVVSAQNGVLANDFDADNDSLTVTIELDPTDGTVQLNDDGSFSYAPDAGFSGVDTFVYSVHDGTETSSPATVSIQVNPIQAGSVTLASIKDNTLIEDATGAVSGGASDSIYAGQNGRANLLRGLIQFDIASNVPAGATITNVELTLHMERTQAGEFDVSLHRVLADWGEAGSAHDGGAGAPSETGDATWLHTFFSSSTWTLPGGDFETTASATTSVDGIAQYQWTSSSMVADVQAWLDDPSNDFGWIVIGDESVNSSKRFSSRESSDEANRPSLLVEYETLEGSQIVSLAVPTQLAAEGTKTIFEIGEDETEIDRLQSVAAHGDSSIRRREVDSVFGEDVDWTS